MASPTIKTVDTLDITFHIVDNTAVGDQFTWKFNNPDSSVNSLSAVRAAFGGQSGFLSDWFKGVGGQPQLQLSICDARGYDIDMVDAAKKVQTVTTKEDLG